MSCQRSPSRTSKNHVPTIGIKDAKPRACTGEKNEMVGSRLSTAPLKNDYIGPSGSPKL
ncbi:hypothetical protein [Ignatzschineria indica]|uniref:hypothetical protein n=1 Tax=Ignatzschineria indica TaxID=472583 RepID=UPI0013004CC5|nr:hypothetical protein [Ignatzschineria indica]